MTSFYLQSHGLLDCPTNVFLVMSFGVSLSSYEKSTKTACGLFIHVHVARKHRFEFMPLFLTKAFKCTTLLLIAETIQNIANSYLQLPWTQYEPVGLQFVLHWIHKRPTSERTINMNLIKTLIMIIRHKQLRAVPLRTITSHVHVGTNIWLYFISIYSSMYIMC